MKPEELNPELFTYDNYDWAWWDAFDLGPMDNHKKAIKKHCVGYCDGSRLSVRPKSGMYAIMCEVDGRRFWFHIEDFVFERIFRDDQ